MGYIGWSDPRDDVLYWAKFDTTHGIQLQQSAAQIIAEIQKPAGVNNPKDKTDWENYRTWLETERGGSVPIEICDTLLALVKSLSNVPV